MTLEAADTRWVFRPRAAGDPGAYRLVAPILEDPAGNRIGHSFEGAMSKTTGGSTPDAYRPVPNPSKADS